jgi:hypothetical protein
VVSPALATLLAIDLGLSHVLWLALLIYIATLSAFPPPTVAKR